MEELPYPFTFEELTEEERELMKLHGDRGRDVVRRASSKCCYVRRILKFGSLLYNFKPRPDDIWLIGYPRSGTTMTQEILYILGTDFDYEKARTTVMDIRFPYLEHSLLRCEDDKAAAKVHTIKDPKARSLAEALLTPACIKLEKITEKRFIKSHMGFEMVHPELLEIGCKVVFIVRNIKDCIASDYYFPANAQAKKEYGILKFWELYKRHLCVMSNYFEILKEAWERRNNKICYSYFTKR
ncbi:hypothetical protein HHI36_013982 [Cryptolaemus montrouzieri]|uniref:Sulfotransferase domain-containing protein n=1 Tax=Cryptolaemus montrouzieri TaxID=559131 RepID=A0ABD2N1G8_9CUCU